jgi:hypothetical protein
MLKTTIKDNQATGAAGEALAREAFIARGYAVSNLNEIASNFPLADFTAQVGRFRLLVQVRGTTTRSGWFQMRSEEACEMQRLAEAFGHYPLYVFVDVRDKAIRCGTADEVDSMCLHSFGLFRYEGLSFDDPKLFDISRLENLVTAEENENDIDDLLAHYHGAYIDNFTFHDNEA